MFIGLPKVIEKVPGLGKQQVSYSGPKAYSQEEPPIECHRNQHEKIAQSNLDHVQSGLEQVHSNAHRIVLNTVYVYVCGCGDVGVWVCVWDVGVWEGV